MSTMASQVTKKIGTHNGSFHCDEVLACSMLRVLPRFHDAEIVRTRDPSLLSGCDVVVDVGGEFDPARHRYDHHQSSFKENISTLVKGKRWTTKLSSAGLVYVHFGKEVIKEILKDDNPDDVLVEVIFDKVYENFIEEVDATDNGIPICEGKPRYQVTTTLSCRVANLRPAWNDAKQDFDAGFWRAMALVTEEFQDRVRFYAHVWWPARALVTAAIEQRFQVHPSGKIILFEGGTCPFKTHVHELEEEQGLEGQILFAVFQDPNSTWRALAVGVKGTQFESRMPLFKDWWALRDQNLIEKSGIADCIFVHATGFIGGNKTKEGALEMASRTMELTQADNNCST